jgi:hypothetical protein
MSKLAITALVVFSSCALSVAANAQMRQFCVVIPAGKSPSLTYLPTNSKVSDCAILAQGLEQQPAAGPIGPGPGGRYSIGCQSGGLFMISPPRAWNSVNLTGGDLSQPGLPAANIASCANTWGFPP